MTIPEKIRKALREVTERWDTDKQTTPPEAMKFPNWYGFGTSGSDDAPTLTLYIARTTPSEEEERLKTTIAQIPDVPAPETIRISRFRMSAEKPSVTPTQLRPGDPVNASSPGCSPDPCPGTVGAFVHKPKTTEPVWLLTCHHVLLSKEVCAKKVLVKSNNQKVSEGTVLFVPIRDQPEVNRVDVALAELIEPKAATPLYSPIKIVDTIPVRPPTGTKVQKLGATSKVTTGKILKYCPRMEILNCPKSDRFTFEDLIMIQSLPGEDDFAQDGDSGSLIISAEKDGSGALVESDQNKRPVGLLIAILDSDDADSKVDDSELVTAMACPWDNVLSEIAKSIFPVEMMLTPNP